MEEEHKKAVEDLTAQMAERDVKIKKLAASAAHWKGEFEKCKNASAQQEQAAKQAQEQLSTDAKVDSVCVRVLTLVRTCFESVSARV